MDAVKTMSSSLENDYEDLDNIHKKLSKKFHKYVTNDNINEFDDNQKNLVNALTQIANAKLGIFRNYKIQKQLDELNKMIDKLPDDVKRKYFVIDDLTV